MANWVHINAGYDPGDETVLFGTRAFAETDGYMYEISTLATIQAEKEVNNVPSLSSERVPAGGVCVSIDNTLIVFEDDSCSSVIFSNTFDSKIDVFCCSLDSKFLFVGLSNGFIHCLHIPTGGQLVFSKKLSKFVGGISTFCKIIITQRNAGVEVFSVCTTGVCACLQNLDLNALDSACTDNDVAYINVASSKICERIVCGTSSISPLQSVILKSGSSMLEILAVGNGIATLNLESTDSHWIESHINKSWSLVKVESLRNKTLCFALSNTGQLMAVCTETLTVVPVLCNITRLVDFKVFVSPSSETIIVGLSPWSEEKQSCLVMLSVHGGQEKFSLPIRGPSKLMSSSLDMEDLHFLECSSVEECSGLSLVAIKTAAQTNPKFRMERLLNKRRFEEAEAIAKNFGLNVDAIHMAQAKYLIEQLQPWGLSSRPLAESIEQLFHMLIKELDQISDLDFVCKCCLSAIPPDHTTASSLLEYAQQRLALFVINNPEQEHRVAELSQQTFGTMLRLETMNIVKHSWDVDQWLAFSRTDLFSEVQQYLKQGDLFEAATIWSRHKAEIKKSFGNSKILDLILESMPPNIPLDKLLVWLKLMLPMVLEVEAEALSNVASWVAVKICDLERSHFRSWPQVGLEYCDKMMDVLSGQKMAGPFLGVDCSPLRPLVQLHSDLSYILDLQMKYFVHLTLEEFRQDPAEVVALMLDKVEVGTISSLIQGFISQFMLDHKLFKDNVISAYILEVLHCSGGWWFWDSAPWETRVAELCFHVSNLELRLDCIIQTLEAAPIPWSPVINSLAESGLKLKHPLCSGIREKQKQVSTNLILKKYNLKRSITQLDKRRLIRYIIKANRPELLEDIAELAQDRNEEVQFYMDVLTQHVDIGNIKKASKVLWSLAKDISELMCPRLVVLVTRKALSGVCSVDHALEFLGALDLCYRAVTGSRTAGISLSEDKFNSTLIPLSILHYRNMLYLKRDFGTAVTFDEISSFEKCCQILERVIIDMLMEVEENETEHSKIERLYQKATYLARLLKIPQAMALTMLAEQLLVVNEVHLAVNITRHIEDMQEVPSRFYSRIIGLGERFFSKCKDLIGSQRQHGSVLKEMADEALNLVAKAGLHCDIDNLKRILEVIGWLQGWRIACGNGDENPMGQRDALHQWRITPVYRDPGIAVLLDGSILVQFLADAHDIACAEGDVQKILELPERALRLQNEQHDETLLFILCQLLSALQRHSSKCVPQTIERIHPTFLNVCEGLLAKVVSARQLDLNLGLNLLLNLGRDLAMNWLSKKSDSSQFDLNKQKQLTCLGMNVCYLRKMPVECSQFRQLYLLSSWGLKLREHGISSKDLYRDVSCDSKGILDKLVSSKSIDCSVIQSFCEDYGLDLENALLSHLTNVLLSWDPNPIVTVNSEGNKEMLEGNTQQELFSQCWNIQKLIQNREVLCKLLFSLWEKVSFYHHEVFLVVLDILEKIGVSKDINSKRLLTTFLKSYRRVKPPGEAEEEFWSEIFPSSYGLPLIAQFRLPYNRRLVETPLNVVRGEINLDTYKSWLSMALALNLTKDKICTIAVHETVTEVFSGTQHHPKWCETRKNEALFTAVAECVAEMDDIVQAAATLFFFTNKTPPGADQVTAATLCVQYGEIVVKQTGDTEYKHKIEKKYFNLATTQILYSYGLGQPCYLQWINNPEELIQQLYQHPNVLETCRGTALHKIDINGATQEIGELNNICLKSLHLNLIMDLLQPEPLTSANNSLDEDTMSGMSLALRLERQTNKHSVDIFTQNDDNLLRARYIMESGDVQNWIFFLLALVFGEQKSSSISIKLRALQCICMLTDDETLEELSGRTASYLRNYYRLLGYIRELEYLGFAYSETGFEKCDKKELALLVIRTSLYRPRAVSFLMNLCLDFGVTELSVWGPLLQQMVDLALIQELEQLLPQVTSTYQLWNLPSFKKAWSLILLAPITQDVSEEASFRALELFSLCPVLSSIQLSEAVEYCILVKRVELCALMLPFMKICERLPLMEKLLHQIEADKLLEGLKNLPVNECLRNKAVDEIKSYLKKTAGSFK